MRGFLAIFAVELKSLVRSKSLLAGFAATVLWMWFLPEILTSDGTSDGARELYVKYSLGAVFAAATVAFASAAAGSMALERSRRTLHLALVRPVRIFCIALAKTCASGVAGAALLLVAAAVLLFKCDASRPASRVLDPELEPVSAEARRMYEAYMSDPDTPDEIKKADRSFVIGILKRKAAEHYATIRPGETASWSFPAVPAGAAKASVGFKFATAFSGRYAMKGTLSFADGEKTEIEEFTQETVERDLPQAGKGRDVKISFRNGGSEALLLRPRKDVKIRYSMPGDIFAANLAFAWVELSSLLFLSVSFAVFLGASFGRSVAVFAVLAALFVSVAAPAAVEEYDGEVSAPRMERISSAVSRAVAAAVMPFDAVSPVGDLASDRRIPTGETVAVFAADAALIPLAFAFLSAIAARKRED